MALAVKNAPETAPQRSVNRLAVGSLTGTVYVLGSLAILFYGIPALWSATVSSWLASAVGAAVDATLLGLVLIAAIVGLVFLGRRLIGTSPAPGVRAGTFVGVVGVLVIGAIACGIGGMLESSLLTWASSENQAFGLGITGLIALGLLVAGSLAYFRPGFDQWLVRFEEQGWFSASAYKRSQGQRVRRGTILAIIVLGGCGIFSMERRSALDTGSPHWGYRLPFVYMDELVNVSAAHKGEVIADLQKLCNLSPDAATQLVDNLPQPVKVYTVKEDAEQLKQSLEAHGARVAVENQLVVVLPHVKFTLPLLLAACTLWLAYRIVHYPAFADFLIATEAELNKVSWTTRKRLVQDTIVVLTTMLFLTLFLFVVDLVWFKLLSAPWIGVLQAGQSNTEMIKDLDAQIERLQQEREAAALKKDFDKETALVNEIDALTREKQNLLRKTTGEEDW